MDKIAENLLDERGNNNDGNVSILSAVRYAHSFDAIDFGTSNSNIWRDIRLWSFSNQLSDKWILWRQTIEYK